MTFSSAVIAGSSWNDWKTKPDHPAAQRRPPVFVERVQIVPVDLEPLPADGVSSPASSAEQRGLARPGDADDGNRFAGADFETHVGEYGQFDIAGANLLAETRYLDDGAVSGLFNIALRLVVACALALVRRRGLAARRYWCTGTACPPATACQPTRAG